MSTKLLKFEGIPFFLLAIRFYSSWNSIFVLRSGQIIRLAVFSKFFMTPDTSPILGKGL